MSQHVFEMFNFEYSMFKNVSNETKVGALTAVAITILILGYNFMVGKDNPFSTSRIFIVHYDSTLGIGISAPVIYNGLKIGQLKKLSLNDESNKIDATMEIFSNLSIPKKSFMKIESAILGTPSIRLILSNNKSYAEDGDKLEPMYSTNILSSVNQKIDPIAAKADSVLASLNALISRKSLVQSIDRIPVVLKGLELTIGTLKSSIEGMNPAVANIISFTNDLDEYSASLKMTLDNFAAISKDIHDIEIQEITNSIKKTITALNSFTEKINTGDGSLAKLANDDELYLNLTKATANLNKLTIDLQKFPEKYVPLPWGGRKRRKAKEKSDVFFKDTVNKPIQ